MAEFKNDNGQSIKFIENKAIYSREIDGDTCSITLVDTGIPQAIEYLNSLDDYEFLNLYCDINTY